MKVTTKIILILFLIILILVGYMIISKPTIIPKPIDNSRFINEISLLKKENDSLSLTIQNLKIQRDTIIVYKDSIKKFIKPIKYVRERETQFYKEGIKDNDYGFKFKPKHDQKAAKLSALRFYDEFKDKIEKMPKKKKSYNPFKSKRNKLVKAERKGLL